MASALWQTSREYSWQLILGCALLVGATTTWAECNVCQDNQAACINSTSFYLCFGDSTPNTDVLYHCSEGFDCTDLNAICLQSSSTRQPSCGDTSQCGQCSAHINYLFACQSRTTFQMCYGAIRPTGSIGYCPDGYVCDATSDAICVIEGSQTEVTCDVVTPTEPDSTTTTTTTEVPTTETSTAMATATTTTTESTTSTSTTAATDLTASEVCAQAQTTGLMSTSPVDPYCIRYVYCYYSSGVLTGKEYTCPTGSYFQVAMQRCSISKPDYCA